MVTKKDGSKQICADYHKLNDVTVKETYALIRINDSSCLDLNSGYWQMSIEESDRPKTGFVLKSCFGGRASLNLKLSCLAHVISK